MKTGAFLLIIAAALAGSASPGNAATIKAFSYAEDYIIKLLDRIEDRDYYKLTALIKSSGSFPDSLQLESKGGDIAEGMEIGRLARQAMLSTTAAGICNGACFIAWAGGVERKALVPMNIQLPDVGPNQAARIRDYLQEMEVPDEIIETAFIPDTRPMDPEEIMIAVGGDSPGHQRWLAESCGALTPDELQDWRAIQALEAMENSLENMGMAGGQNSGYSLGSETQQLASRAMEFSEEYRTTIDRSYAEISKCRNSLIDAVRASLDL